MITFRNVSIIIPVGPFEPALETLLRDLSTVEQEAEIILVGPDYHDGSLPPTPSLEGRGKGESDIQSSRVKSIFSPQGRARQLNEGEQKASRDFLWFLHADSRFSPETLKSLLQSLNNNPHVLHYFNLRFLPDGPPLMFLNEVGCWIRSRILGVPFGDQGFAISKENFERIGGFPEGVPCGEDHLFVWRARQKGIRLRCTGVSLYTSARRYAETGWAKLTWIYACRWTRQAIPEWWKLAIGIVIARKPKADEAISRVHLRDRHVPFDSAQGPRDDKHLNQNVLVIFAKYPEAGQVKSRLARTIGETNAAFAYKTMVEIVVRNTRPCNGEYAQVLYYDPPESRERFRSWLQISHQKPQSGGNLGERMKQAFSQALAESKYSILIGTDCTDVDRSLIGKAFQNLKEVDLVLGPAKDGGYYLIGCKKVYPELFSHIEWSTEHVLSQTLKAANALKLSVSLLPELEDIDTSEQYYGRFREKIRPDLAVL